MDRCVTPTLIIWAWVTCGHWFWSAHTHQISWESSNLVLVSLAVRHGKPCLNARLIGEGAEFFRTPFSFHLFGAARAVSVSSIAKEHCARVTRRWVLAPFSFSRLISTFLDLFFLSAFALLISLKCRWLHRLLIKQFRLPNLPCWLVITSYSAYSRKIIVKYYSFLP